MSREFLDKSLDDFIRDFDNARTPSRNFKENLKKLVKELSERSQLKDVLHLLTKENLLRSQDGNNENFVPLDIEEFLEYLEEKRREKSACKIFNDPIHGHMEIHPACVLIIDTPQFQRLRYIKQLGMCYFVYPGASHNRFEHSIGTCYLAGQFCRSLRGNQPELGITDMDILCVEIAGLCHDLGQGPFSRLFVDRLGPLLSAPTSDAQGQPQKEYARKHNVPSAQMFDYLLSKNQEVKDKLKNDYGISEAELCFIKEQIDGPPVTGSTAWPYKGRPEFKAYLYEIVSNLRNGIDVCKWDYLARDCHHLGMPNSFDHRRYMQFARVIEESGEHQICLRDKEVGNVYQMFSIRYNLNKNAYKHPVNCAIEEMVVDALKEASEHFKFGISQDDNFLGMSMLEYFQRQQSQGNKQDNDNKKMSALSEMTDDVLYKIRNDTNLNSRKSKDLLERIFNRKLYTCVHKTEPMELPNGITVATITTKIIEMGVSRQNFFVQIVHLDFGMKEENPVRRLRVYGKDNLHEARHLPEEEVSRILNPPNYNEQVVRIYSKSIDQDIIKRLKNVAKKKEIKNDKKVYSFLTEVTTKSS